MRGKGVDLIVHRNNVRLNEELYILTTGLIQQQRGHVIDNFKNRTGHYPA